MRNVLYTGRMLAVAWAAIVSCACSSHWGVAPLAQPPMASALRAQAPFDDIAPAGIRKVKHVVIIIQENRSVDNLFQGLPNADTRSYGYDSHGRKIALRPLTMALTWDLQHDSTTYFQSCNGRGNYPGTDCRMNGFNLILLGCGHYDEPRCPMPNPAYSYVPHSETEPYFDMAEKYVFADHMFASNFDISSFVSHQYIIAGQAYSTVNYPYYQWGCEGGSSDLIATLTQQRQIATRVPVCFNAKTLGDELDDAGLSWRYYASDIDGNGGLWSAYQAVRHIYYGSDWSKDVVSPQTRFFKDVSRGKLPVVSWVTPTWPNSDHAGGDSKTGPSWVASLVNAIGESKYWKSTVIFVFWDDPGGWYDHVPPKFVDFEGLGMRIPMLIISPYAKKGYVSHVSYEHGSILKFIEDRFGLARLAASDARANSPEPYCFDFSQPPRPFVPIRAPYDENFFLHQPIDHHPPDTE